VVTLRDTGCEPNAREPQTESAIPSVVKPIEWGRSLRFAESNGAKVITAIDLPESILEALAGLVDAVQREFGDAHAQRLTAEADQPKPLCRWHIGQLAEFCGPCRSEEIGAS
jgi:hypothetical protein